LHTIFDVASMDDSTVICFSVQNTSCCCAGPCILN